MAVPADKVYRDLSDAMEVAQDRPAAPATRRTAPAPRRATGLLDWFAPAWALRAEQHIRTESAQVRSLIMVVALLVFVVGFFGAVGGGYASIQAVRLALVWLGVPVRLDGIPAPAWWALPLGNTLIQVTARRLPAVRRLLWAPSLWFDGATTGSFLAVRMLPGALILSPAHGLYAGGAVGAILGMLVAIIVEHLLFGALVMVRGARQ